MKHKGFTLIELLGVIVILGLLAVIAIPIVDNSINKNKENLYHTQLNQIIKGAEDYYATHLSSLPKNEGETKKITISQLQNNGNLPLDIKNPRTNENFSPNTTIIVTKTGKNYKYKVDEETIKWKKDLH